jgi:protein-disulfide isomerase
MTDLETQPKPATTEAPRPAGNSGWILGVVLAAACLALAIAVATWFISKQQTDSLRHDLTALQDSYRQLAVQITQGRPGGAGPVGQIIDVSRSPARGREDAVVTLIEFSDYECPFCIRHVQQTMPLLDQNYIQSGKIRYVFRDFPIDSNHPQAVRAHEAAHCALEQNKFWEIHRVLFSAPGTHTPLALEDRAKEAGLNMDAYRACIAAGKTTPGIRQSAALADSLGATGTPWFFLGIRDLKTNQVRILKPIGGAQPYEQFVVAIDAALRDVGKK